ALGITEETDAVVVVVSEERGTISFCFNGNIAPDLQANQLREMLISILAPKAGKADAPPAHPSTTDRVSIRSQEPVIADAPRLAPRTTAGSTPPPPLTAPQLSIAPTPLRKSTLPNQPLMQQEEETGSIKLPLAQPRPIPKASDIEPLSEEPQSDPRSTPH
ncbi:MAG TPA: diadenylate cyclase, partial [Polyangiaceae bacterium]|nr:diadenylate cyclase [Polyangiaceae bacterium]